jgi:hypothetical protein
MFPPRFKCVERWDIFVTDEENFFNVLHVTKLQLLKRGGRNVLEDIPAVISRSIMKD